MERAILSAHLTLTALAGLAVLAVTPLLGPTLGLWAACIFVPGTLVGVQARALATTRGALGASTAISAAAFVAVLAVILAEAILGAEPSVPLLLAVNGLAQGVASVLVIHRLSGAAPANFGAGARRRWRVLLRRSGWPMLAGLGNEVFNRLYIFIVPAWFGAASLANLAAAQTMLRPATLLAGAFGAAARNPLAARRHAGDAPGFWRLLVIGGAVPALITLLWGCALAVLWPWIVTWLYAGRYAGLQPVVLLWGAQLSISCFWVAFLVGLQALARLRALAMAELGGALVCAAAMPLLLLWLSPPGAIVAMILGGLVQVSLLGLAVRRALR